MKIISNGPFLWLDADGYQQNQLKLPAGIWAGDNVQSSQNLNRCYLRFETLDFYCEIQKHFPAECPKRGFILGQQPMK